ncbi:MAG: sensor histidine kinase [Halodesulfovibrio sp.]|uniref:sensor histidine kinase n=1 Tax=Halodesulfovibrio sp. TaxID=1912772 RepID=UPI00359EFFB8
MYPHKLPSWYPSSFAARLVLLLVIVFSVINIGGMYLVRSTMVSFTAQQTEEEIEAIIKNIGHVMTNHSIQAAEHALIDYTQSWKPDRVASRIYDESGRVISSSKALSWKILWPAFGVNSAQIIQTQHGHDIVYVASRVIKTPNGNYTLQIAKSLKQEHSFLMRLESAGVSMFILTLVGLIISGWVAASFAMKELEKITHAAEIMAGGIFIKDLPPSHAGSDINRLIAAFNKSSRRTSSLVNELSDMNDHLAHDLKTPVTQIRGTAELLLTQKQKEKTADKLGDIIEGCDVLQDIINSSLDAAEIKAGIRKIEKQPLSLSELFSTLEENYSPLAEAKGITINVTPSLTFINADKTLLYRSLANILDNAIKFTPPNGQISLWSTSNAAADIIAISDSGIGFPEKAEQHIFSRFYRADSSRTIKGHGLGLYIAKTIISAHNGTITATNNSSHTPASPQNLTSGVTFRVFIPPLPTKTS